MKKELLDGLDKIDALAKASKITRLCTNPFKYIAAISFKEFIYPKTKKEKIVTTTLFYGKKMRIGLPASTDIYLTGGKSHSSEVRLGKFLVLNLVATDHFMDIGAHYGYFSLLASELVGKNGRVFSFEPASSSFKLLHENTTDLPNVRIYAKAVSSSDEDLIFYEFPNLQSEYSTSDISQFENESWFTQSMPEKKEVKATTIDFITKDGSFSPAIIKIDVEGAELNVLQGGLAFLSNSNPKVVMEYVNTRRGNETHKKALDFMLNIGYKIFIINKDGSTDPIKDVDAYLDDNHLESDNLVFLK